METYKVTIASSIVFFVATMLCGSVKSNPRKYMFYIFDIQFDYLLIDFLKWNKKITIIYLKVGKRFSYRVSNNGATGWRPSVQRIQVFSDQGCSKDTLATYIDDSGHNFGFGNGSAAFDNDRITKWRPQCLNCTKGEAWITFSTTEEARCIIATNLGKGRIGNLKWNNGTDVTWNNGLIVELKNPDGSWMKIMESFRDNSVVIGILTHLCLCNMVLLFIAAALNTILF